MSETIHRSVTKRRTSNQSTEHELEVSRCAVQQGFSTCGPRTPGGPLTPGGPRATPEKLETRRILTINKNTGHINVAGTGYNVQN